MRVHTVYYSYGGDECWPDYNPLGLFSVELLKSRIPESEKFYALFPNILEEMIEDAKEVGMYHPKED